MRWDPCELRGLIRLVPKRSSVPSPLCLGIEWRAISEEPVNGSSRAEEVVSTVAIAVVVGGGGSSSGSSDCHVALPPRARTGTRTGDALVWLAPVCNSFVAIVALAGHSCCSCIVNCFVFYDTENSSTHRIDAASPA